MAAAPNDEASLQLLEELINNSNRLSRVLGDLCIIRQHRRNVADILASISDLGNMGQAFEDFKDKLREGGQRYISLEQKSIEYINLIIKCAKISRKMAETAIGGQAVLTSTMYELLDQAAEANCTMNSFVRQHNDIIADVDDLCRRAGTLKQKADAEKTEQILGAIPVVAVISDAIHGAKRSHGLEKIPGFVLGALKGALSSITFPVTTPARIVKAVKYDKLVDLLQDLKTSLPAEKMVIERNKEALAKVVLSLEKSYNHGKNVNTFLRMQDMKKTELILKRFLQSSKELDRNCRIYLGLVQ